MVERNPKRARKKEARDRRTAAYAAAYRRRRIARVVAVVVAVAVIGALVIYTTGNDDSTQPAAGDAASPSTTPTPPPSPCPDVAAPDSNPTTDYPAAPDPSEVLESGVDYSAVIETSCGDIEVDLLEERPATIASFIFLAQEGYFDGLTWHRIERNFVIQSGDPNGLNGQPPDGPGYQIPDEVDGTRDRDYTFGTLAMANAGPDTGGSQFFFVVHDPKAARAGARPEPAGLEPLYTIFGRAASSSFGVLDKIARQPIKGGSDQVTASQPIVPVYIETIEIISN